MGIGIQRAALFLLALFFSAALYAYLFVQDAWSVVSSGGSLAQGDMCEPGQSLAAQKTNPHSMLFISCGGFLE